MSNRSRRLGILVLAGLLLRIGLCFNYEPVTYPDTSSYWGVARSLCTGDFSGYEGRRTPGYPALIALVGLRPQNVWALQMVMGVLISGLLFYVTVLITGRTGLALITGMTYNLNMSQLFFEANLLSETTGTLSMVAVTVAILVVHRRLQNGRPVTMALLLLAGVASFAVMTRPQFIFLTVLPAALIAAASVSIGALRMRLILKHAALTVLPTLFVVIGWCAFNYARVGSFTLSTNSAAMGLVQHSLSFIELTPHRYAKIRDIYIKYREAKLSTTGNYIGAEFDALPELLTATGMTWPALNRELQQMSLLLYTRHPMRYAGSVAHAWVDFWLVPIYWDLDALSPRSLRKPLGWFWWAEHWLLRAVNATFLLLLIAWIVSRRLRARTGSGFGLFSIGALVLLASVVQAFMQYGENARYAITVQPLVVVAVLIAGCEWVHHSRHDHMPGGVVMS